MMNQAFHAPTNILMGDMLHQTLEPYRRIFLVTDRFMEESGKAAYVRERVWEGAQCHVFCDIGADPDTGSVSRGVSDMLAFAPDAVVAFGGGSAIDAAKAIVYFAAEAGGVVACPFIAVPTTSGTGSEMSRFAVITDLEKEVKYPLVDDRLLPDVAVLDAALVKSVPPSLTADTGMDVFTHAVEAFVSTQATDFSDAAAEKAIRLVREHLVAAYEQPENLDARQGMHNASCLAGIAFSNSGLGLTHGMAHALGARFHIPHGRANAILLPHVLSYNAGCADSLTPVAKKYAQIARLMEQEATSTRQSALNLIRTARRYLDKLHIPATIHALGVAQPDFEQALEAMAQAALADRCTATNPKACGIQEITAIFRKAYIGKYP